jgi:hypothetical protein
MSCKSHQESTGFSGSPNHITTPLQLMTLLIIFYLISDAERLKWRIHL